MARHLGLGPVLLAAFCASCGGSSERGALPDPGVAETSATDDSGSVTTGSVTEGSSTDGSSTDGSSTETAASTTDGSPMGSTDGDTTDPLTCETCLPLPPEGWQGPVVRAVAATEEALPDCGGHWHNELARGFAALDAASAQCSCECDAQASVCPDTGTVAMSGLSNSATCPNAAFGEPGAQSYQAAAASWQALTPPAEANRWWRMENDGVVAPACNVDASVTVPPAATHDYVRLCATDGLQGSCDPGFLCTPASTAPFEQDLCFWQAGEHECPGGYDDRLIYFRGTSEDSRGCSPCTCTADAAPACSGRRVVLQAGPLEMASVADGSCVMISFAPEGLRLLPGEPHTPSCAPSQPSVPSGTLDATDPMTVCCRS